MIFTVQRLCTSSKNLQNFEQIVLVFCTELALLFVKECSKFEVVDIGSNNKQRCSTDYSLSCDDVILFMHVHWATKTVVPQI